MSRLKPIIFISLILTFFFQFLRMDLWDYDFWWHITTGRYIITEGHLPEKDPFSFTSSMEENKNLYPERENFILKQYWLSQVIFYLLYDYAGVKGIILLRSSLYIMTLLFVLWRLQRWSVSLPVSFISAFSLFMLFTSKLTGERPVLFTILFTAVIFFILEDFRDKKDNRIFLLPPLMLLWSNLHGGFIIGVVIIMIFMFCEGLKIILKRSAYTRREIILFYTATIVALGLSFINPTGWDAFTIALSSKYKPFIEGIQEYDSLFMVYKERLSSVNSWYVALAILFPMVLIIRNRRLDFTHIMLLTTFLIMSVSAVRFQCYYGIIAAMVIGREIDIWLKDIFSKRFSEQIYRRLLNWLTLATVFSLILFMVSFTSFKSPSFNVASAYSVPERAVDFVEKNRLQGNMLNDYGYGGYLSWRLYPREKTFIDSRAMNLTVMTEYGWIVRAVDSIYRTEPSPTKGPLWERLLTHYNINFIFLNPYDVHGTVLPVIFKLSDSDKWVPVYCDPIIIIFVKNTEQNRYVIERFRLSKEVIYNTLIYQSARLALTKKVNPRPLMSLGETFYEMGRLEEAIKAYQYALKRMPESPVIKRKLAQIESEMEERKRK
ncbi:MAG: tetratricopeptide repeat protein [Nitrospirota bacterium]